jgi:RNA polymerase sigma-70 factor (ECF subfamily)
VDLRESLERAYLAHKDRLFTLATALTGDRAAAEDVVHDVFASLIEQPRRVRGGRALAAFLSVCARNRALDWLRTQGRRAAREAMGAAPANERGRDDPVERASRKEEEEMLLAMVGSLPGELREVLALRVWGGLGFREIAHLQGVATSTAHRRYSQALQNIRTQFPKGH